MSPGMKKWQDEQDEKIQAAKQAEETAKTTSRQQNAAWLKEFNAEWASKVHFIFFYQRFINDI